MDVAEKLQFARQIVTAMTGNANFATPDPTLASVSGYADDLENAYNAASVARQNATTLTSVQDDKENMLDTTLMKLSNYVENVIDSDETIIQSAGMSYVQSQYR